MAVSEAERVRAVYAARTGGRDLYDPLRPEVAAMAAERHRAWGSTLLAVGARPRRVLEVGSGGGQNLRWALEVGADHVVGVDVIDGRLRDAQSKNPRTVGIVGDGQRLPFHAGSFDTVICSTLFSSVLDDGVRQRIAGEVDRVVAGGGRVLWFDFVRDNPKNRDVAGVDVGTIRALFPAFVPHLERVVLAPPIGRRVGPRLGDALRLLPPLRTHLAGCLVRA